MSTHALNECWKNCMSMWRWIHDNWEEGMSVYEMKEQWLRKHKIPAIKKQLQEDKENTTIAYRS